MTLDANFCETPKHAEGCTAICALIQPEASSDGSDDAKQQHGQDGQNGQNGDQKKKKYRVAVINVGDSRLLWISSTGECLFSTTDHKPYVLLLPGTRTGDSIKANALSLDMVPARSVVAFLRANSNTFHVSFRPSHF